jgi:hypothetical protein
MEDLTKQLSKRTAGSTANTESGVPITEGKEHFPCKHFKFFTRSSLSSTLDFYFPFHFRICREFGKRNP